MIFSPLVHFYIIENILIAIESTILDPWLFIIKYLPHSGHGFIARIKYIPNLLIGICIINGRAK